MLGTSCYGYVCILFFFFKQKTAYEMRISDWSSDVCSSDLMREGGVVLVTGRAYATRAGVVAAEEIFYDQAARPDGKGPWLGEADKVSWRDEASGYDCIMLRDTDDGFLAGYVGIPQDRKSVV